MRRLWLTCGLILIMLAGCTKPKPMTGGNEGADPTAEVELILNWFPEAEHGGFYAAQVHGYFEEEGLRVKIVSGGPNIPVIQIVAGKPGSFGIANADQILLGRAQQADVVGLMAPLQMSPRCIMVHESSGIRSFDDLQNMTLAISANSTFAQYLRKKVPLTGVQIVPYPGNVAQFLLRKDYGQQAYVFSEPYVAEKQGAKPHNLMLSELGFNPYTSVLFTHAETVKQNPEIVRKLVRASVRGWQKYLADPADTNARIAQLNPEMGSDILEFGVRTLHALCITDEVGHERLGRMTADRWQQLNEQLVEAGALDAPVAANAAFTVEYLEETHSTVPETEVAE